MAEEIKLGPKRECSCKPLGGGLMEKDERCPIHGLRDPKAIFDASVRIYEMGEYAAEEAYDLACELWDRAFGFFQESEE